MKSLAAIVLSIGFVTSASGQLPNSPVRSVLDPGVVTTRQQVTPAGTQTVFSGRVYGVTFGKTESEIYVLTGAEKSPLYQIDWKQNRIEKIFHDDARSGIQGVVWDAEGQRPLVSAIKPATVNGKREQQVMLMTASNGELQPVGGKLGLFAAGGISVASNKRRAAVALTFDNEVAVIDLAKSTLAGSIKVGIAPFTTVIDRDGAVGYVSNWGGRLARPGEPTAQTGHQDSKDQVVVDERGIVSTGTVSRVDLAAMKVTDTIAVGLNPTAMVWDAGRERLDVENK